MAPSFKSNPQQVHLDRRFWLVLGALALMWGSTFAANQATLSELDSYTTLALRSLFSTLLMWGVVFYRQLHIPRNPGIWLGLGGLGMLSMFAPNFLVLWGQQFVASGLAGILNASVALFTVVFATSLLPDERLTISRAAGVVCGFIGVVVALGRENLSNFDLKSIGQVAIILAAAIYACSAVLSRRYVRGTAPEVVVAIFMTATTLVSLPLAFALKGMPSLVFGPQAWLGLSFLVLFASVGSYLLLYLSLPRYGASNLNLSTLLTGPIAIVLGALLYDESLPYRVYQGFGLIAIGLILIDGRIFKIFKRS